MSYDLHGSWEKFTGHNAPLYARVDEKDEKQRTLNLDWALKYWLSNGVPKEKLNLGLATYGRSFRLAKQSENGMGAPISGPGTAGTVSQCLCIN